MNDRHENGVKVRADGRGDPWANMHRRALGSDSYMSDLDGIIGITQFAANTAERFFLEVVPDEYKNKDNEVRRFALLAAFDRKLTPGCAQGSVFTRQVYTWLCRIVAQAQEQPIEPRFFYVIGSNNPPWKIYEVDIWEPNGGKYRGEIKSGDDFDEVWRIMGLLDARAELKTWVSQLPQSANPPIPTGPFPPDSIRSRAQTGIQHHPTDDLFRSSGNPYDRDA